jgi:CRP-like cAMP-binding protein
MRMMRRWQLTRGTVIFTEGSPGGTCFVILRGEVDVSANRHGRQQLLATMQPGTVFGQISVIGDVPRLATCSARTGVGLLEMSRDRCERLLRGGSPLAIKLLETLNEGLISALRDADRRLMQLEGRRSPTAGPRAIV